MLVDIENTPYKTAVTFKGLNPNVEVLIRTEVKLSLVLSQLWKINYESGKTRFKKKADFSKPQQVNPKI